MVVKRKLSFTFPYVDIHSFLIVVCCNIDLLISCWDICVSWDNYIVELLFTHISSKTQGNNVNECNVLHTLTEFTPDNSAFDCCTDGNCLIRMHTLIHLFVIKEF